MFFVSMMVTLTLPVMFLALGMTAGNFSYSPPLMIIPGNDAQPVKNMHAPMRAAETFDLAIAMPESVDLRVAEVVWHFENDAVIGHAEKAALQGKFLALRGAQLSYLPFGGGSVIGCGHHARRVQAQHACERQSLKHDRFLRVCCNIENQLTKFFYFVKTNNLILRSNLTAKKIKGGSVLCPCLLTNVGFCRDRSMCCRRRDP